MQSHVQKKVGQNREIAQNLICRSVLSLLEGIIPLSLRTTAAVAVAVGIAGGAKGAEVADGIGSPPAEGRTKTLPKRKGFPFGALDDAVDD
jgi:hypothetical protein